VPRSKHPRKTWQYSVDFKVKAVELSLQDGLQVQQVAAGLDIHPFMLSRWRKEYRDGKLKPDGRRRVLVMKDKKTPTAKQLCELEQLREKNARLQKENDLLKKWQRYLAAQHQSGLDLSKSTVNV
jgi:transposase